MQLSLAFPRSSRQVRLPGALPPRLAALGIGVLVLLAAGGVFVYQRVLAPAQPVVQNATVEVRRGTIASTVSATGSTVATKQAKLVFASSGRIQEIPVSIGDQVTAGQPLARLVSDAQQLKVQQAQSQLTVARLKLQALTGGAASQDVAAAQAAYDAAVAKLQDVQAGAQPSELLAAQSAVAQAQAAYDQAVAKLQALQDGTALADRVSAEAALQAAQGSLASAQSKLDSLQDGPEPADLVAAQSALDSAAASVQSAQAKLELTRAGATPADLAAAQAGFDQAQAAVTSAKAKLDQARTATTVPATVMQAQSALAAAESKLHTAHQAQDTLSGQLALANANLAAQQSSLDAAQATANQTCDKMGGSSAECASAHAKLDAMQPQLLDAQQKLQQLSGSGSWSQLGAQKDVLSAQAAYDAAAANLKQAQAANSVQADLVSAQTSYDSAISQLTSARAKLDQVQAGPTAADLAAVQSAYDSAQAQLHSAQAKLDQTQAGATNADLIAAQATTDTANANLQAAQAKLIATNLSGRQDLLAAQGAVQTAKVALDSAQAKLQQLQAGSTAGDLAAARSAVSQAQASLVAKSRGSATETDLALQQEALRQAEMDLRQAQLDLDNLTLLAPFDGVVAAIVGNVGEQAPSGTTGFVTLVDPREVRVDVTVDESDVARITPGKRAQVTFDAVPGRTFQGKVLAVAPSGTLAQGVVTYPVPISIETRGQVLPAGLTASVTITIDQKDGVLTVPSRAVRRQGRQQVVDVAASDGTPETRQVQTGVSNDQLVEVTNGVAEGERVIIPSTSTRAPNAPAGVGVPGFGGGGAVRLPGR